MCLVRELRSKWGKLHEPTVCTVIGCYVSSDTIIISSMLFVYLDPELLWSDLWRNTIFLATLSLIPLTFFNLQYKYKKEKCSSKEMNSQTWQSVLKANRIPSHPWFWGEEWGIPFSTVSKHYLQLQCCGLNGKHSSWGCVFEYLDPPGNAVSEGCRTFKK